MEYVEQRNAGYYVAGTRISLDSVVYALLRGETPEGIQDSYRGLTLEQIFGLSREPTSVDEYLRRKDDEYDRLYEEARARDLAFYANLNAARPVEHRS